MKNLKIGKKLLVTFATILALFLLTVFIAIFGLRTTGANFEDFYSNSYPVSYGTLEMRRAIQSGLKNTMMAMITEDLQQTQQYIQTATEEFNSLAERLTFLKQNFRGDKTLLDKAEAALDKALPYRMEILELASKNQNDQAAEILFRDYQPLMLEAQSYITEADDNTSELADAAYGDSSRLQTLLLIVMVVISVVSLLLTIIMALYITGSLTRPIREIEAAADKMAAGDLNAQVSYTSRDELGSLSNSIRTLINTLQSIIGDADYLLSEIAEGNFAANSKNPDGYVGDFTGMLLSMGKLRDRLSDTLSQINSASDQVSAGSNQVSSGAQALSQGATEQASSIEELAATINEISVQIQSNAQSAQEASAKATSVGDEMTASNRKMEQMMAAMNEISESSLEIRKIIKTIEDIAFQTNILALNAAVEAARAGAAGKGFAVVADEVRNLASKSAEASKNTAALIESSIQAVENGTSIAGDTAHSLLSAVDGAKEVSATIDKISEASNEQANAIAQVTAGVDQISSVVQTNSATAEESAAASEELSGQAQLLKGLVSRFRLTDTARQESGSALPVTAELEYSVQGDKY